MAGKASNVQTENQDPTDLQTSQFLKYPGIELSNYVTIAEENLRAVQKRQQELLLNFSSTLGDDLLWRNPFNKLLELKAENVKNKIANEEHTEEIIAMAKTTEKKKATIEDLEHQLKLLSDEYNKLKIDKERDDQEKHKSIKIFKKAVNCYSLRFQYNIEKGVDEEDKYGVVITFLFEAQKSKYPIQFVFDREANNLLSFDVGELMTTQQQTMLFERFKETNNMSALFCALRHIALKKHKPDV